MACVLTMLAEFLSFHFLHETCEITDFKLKKIGQRRIPIERYAELIHSPALLPFKQDFFGHEINMLTKILQLYFSGL